ncbi:SdiA-regulated domain-containing protein [Pseudomonas sp. DC3000-4b1]|uniref:SdiA-regulated domain-containing protein n=1 Tax=unclassified Pseudomonas TaxID=196821 RepID=UPI003CE9FB64
MSRFALPRLFRFGALVLALTLGTVGLHLSQLPAMAWHVLTHGWGMPGSATGIATYSVSVEARPIAGLHGDVSALTYDPDRNTLFTVTNKTPELVELSLEGQVLRRVALKGFEDPEAVEYVAPGTYVISDERRQRLVQVVMDATTREIDAAQGHQFALGLGLNGNKGFEGLAYDSERKRLFVAKERDPVRIYEIDGFPLGGEGPVAIDVRENPARDRGMKVRDLSSLQFDERTGQLLVVSDESRVIVALDVDGQPVGRLSLSAGSAGLTAKVPQAEGIAMDKTGRLYLVSEPNLFYRFDPRPTP